MERDVFGGVHARGEVLEEWDKGGGKREVEVVLACLGE